VPKNRLVIQNKNFRPQYPKKVLKPINRIQKKPINRIQNPGGAKNKTRDKKNPHLIITEIYWLEKKIKKSYLLSSNIIRCKCSQHPTAAVVALPPLPHNNCPLITRQQTCSPIPVWSALDPATGFVILGSNVAVPVPPSSIDRWRKSASTFAAGTRTVGLATVFPLFEVLRHHNFWVPQMKDFATPVEHVVWTNVCWLAWPARRSENEKVGHVGAGFVNRFIVKP
jgi:hypothetical protein